MTIDRLVQGDEQAVGSNHVEYRLDDPISRAVSWVGNLPAKVLLLSTRVGQPPEEETQADIGAALQEMGVQNTHVRVGHSRILKDMYRLFTDDKVKDVSFVGRLLVGLPVTVAAGILGKLTRADYFNPFTKTAHLYSDVPAIARHELGHARDYQSSKFPTLYSLSRALILPELYQEAKASVLAHRSMKDDAKPNTGRFLVPAFGSYVSRIANAIAPGVGPLATMAGSHVVGNTYNRGRRGWNLMKETVGRVRGIWNKDFDMTPA